MKIQTRLVRPHGSNAGAFYVTDLTDRTPGVIAAGLAEQHARELAAAPALLKLLIKAAPFCPVTVQDEIAMLRALMGLCERCHGNGCCHCQGD
jgi:hypothetical protein